MSRKRTIVIALIGIICIQDAFGQNKRLNTHYAIGWYNYFSNRPQKYLISAFLNPIG